MKHRIEKDSLGEVRVPADALYGAQTVRAVGNFPISGLRLQPRFVAAQAVIKAAAARANMDSGRLDTKIGKAIAAAADEILAGKHAEQFVVDVFQAGAGTSQNMNMNEVLANRAEELLGGARGGYAIVHPNDHVNMSQSTNDTFHVAMHVAAVAAVEEKLLPAAEKLSEALAAKADEFAGVVKCGRTHLQDAVPMMLGDDFGAWAAMVSAGRRRVAGACGAMMELALGGTAVGTGLNADDEYSARAIGYVNEMTGRKFRRAENIFEAMQGLDAVVEVSGAVRVLATSLKKIADDVRLLSSGPRCGLGELHLPAVQPGSSIMPGKVNPSIAEMVNMVCSQVMGCDMAIVHAAQGGQLELNVMMPAAAYNLLLEIEILANAMDALATKCVAGIEADEGVCRTNAEKSNALATALSPAIGYARAAMLAKEALEKGMTVRALAIVQNLLDAETLDKLLDPALMAGKRKPKS